MTDRHGPQMNEQHIGVSWIHLSLLPSQRWWRGHSKEDNASLPAAPQTMEKKEKKGGNNLDLVSSLPVHLMVFPDLEHWRLTFPLKLYFFAPYTLDFRKCTKQDNTAQYNVCLVLVFLFFWERERQKHLRKPSDISTQGWSVFPFLVIFLYVHACLQQ